MQIHWQPHQAVAWTLPYQYLSNAELISLAERRSQRTSAAFRERCLSIACGRFLKGGKSTFNFGDDPLSGFYLLNTLSEVWKDFSGLPEKVLSAACFGVLEAIGFGQQIRKLYD